MQDRVEPTFPQVLELIQAIHNKDLKATRQIIEKIQANDYIREVIAASCQAFPDMALNTQVLIDFALVRDVKLVALFLISHSAHDLDTITKTVMRNLFDLYSAILDELISRRILDKVQELMQLNIWSFETVLLKACKLGFQDMVTDMLADQTENDLITFKELLGFDDLGFAAATGDIKKVTQLFQPNKDIKLNSIDKQGYTPLMWAVKSGNATIVQALLLAGSDPRIESTDGLRQTAFDMALDGKNEQVILALLANTQACHSAKEQALDNGDIGFALALVEAQKAANLLAIVVEQAIDLLEQALLMSDNRSQNLENLKSRMENTYYHSINEIRNVFLLSHATTGRSLSLRMLLNQDKYQLLKETIYSHTLEQSPNFVSALLAAKARAVTLDSQTSQASEEPLTLDLKLEEKPETDSLNPLKTSILDEEIGAGLVQAAITHGLFNSQNSSPSTEVPASLDRAVKPQDVHVLESQVNFFG